MLRRRRRRRSGRKNQTKTMSSFVQREDIIIFIQEVFLILLVY
jgi:hypothetical protein